MPPLMLYTLPNPRLTSQLAALRDRTPWWHNT